MPENDIESLIVPNHGPCPVTFIVNVAPLPGQTLGFPDKNPVGKAIVAILIEELFEEPKELKGVTLMPAIVSNI